MDTMRLKGAVSSTGVLFRKAFLGRQVHRGSGQSSPAQLSSDLGVPREARASRQGGRETK